LIKNLVVDVLRGFQEFVYALEVLQDKLLSDQAVLIGDATVDLYAFFSGHWQLSLFYRRFIEKVFHVEHGFSLLEVFKGVENF
jgi:predicted secreted protein